jgi:hypothetical protein
MFSIFCFLLYSFFFFVSTRGQRLLINQDIPVCEPTSTVILENNEALDNIRMQTLLSEMISFSDEDFVVVKYAKKTLVIYKKHHILYKTKCDLVNSFKINEKPYEKVSGYLFKYFSL